MKKDKHTSLIAHSSKILAQKKWRGIAIGGVILLSVAAFFLRDKFTLSAEEAKSMLATYVVERGDIRTTVDGDGKIINPNIVNLSFLINGTLDQVFVEEGDKVKKGDVIAELDKQEYSFDLRNAQNQVQIVNANIKSKNAELTDDTLRVAEDDMTKSQRDMEIAREELDQTLAQSLESGRVEVQSAFSAVQKALESIDDIWGVDKNNTPYDSVMTTFNDSARENQVKEAYENLKRKYVAMWTEYNSLLLLSDPDVSRFLWQLKGFSEEVQETLEVVADLFNQAHLNTRTTQSLMDEAEGNIQTSLSAMNTKAGALVSAKQEIDSAYSAQQNGVKDATGDVSTSQVKLENSQLEFEKKKITKEAGLSVLYAQLQQAQIEVEKAKYNLGLTTLTSPIDGEVIAVSGNPGEAVKVQSTSTDSALVRILSDENFTTEVYIEEMDIGKVKVGQKANITLDAIEGIKLEGTVSYVANTATIDSNGITTYLVRVDITDEKATDLKEGMSTYVEFVSQEAKNVLLVPEKAVKRNQVELEDGTKVSVKTGLSDGQYTEIKEGLEEGQKIMVEGSFAQRSATQSTAEVSVNEEATSGEKTVLSEDKIKSIEEMLTQQSRLPEGWANMTLDQKRQALQELGSSQSMGGTTSGGLGGSTKGGGMGMGGRGGEKGGGGEKH